MSSDVEKVLSVLEDVQENAWGWFACCPSHDEKAPSLSVNVGEDGRVSLHCHAGCSTKAIVEAAGLPESVILTTGGKNLTPLITTTTTSAKNTSTITAVGLDDKKGEESRTGNADWNPYPVEALPEPLRDFVHEAAASINCEPCYVALPLLAVAGAAIGTTSRLELKPDWLVPSIIWPVVIGESGTAKSPALSAVLDHVDRHEKELREDYQAELDGYDASRLAFEKSLSSWQKSKDTDEPPSRPRCPIARRAKICDSTVEAVAVVLAENPRGVLLARDELAGWFGSMDRYSNGKQDADQFFWCQCYDGRAHSIDRKHGDHKTLAIDTAAVWVTGCIQPGTLRRSLGAKHRESGLLARLLLAAPPKQPQFWSEKTIDVLTKERLHSVLDRLYRLSDTTDYQGNACPRRIRLSAAAKAVWVSWHDEHSQQTISQNGDLAAAWSKLKEVAARIALILHEVEVVTGLHDQPDEVSLATIEAAIRLTEWHKAETVRVYQRLAETDEETETRQQEERLLAFIDRRGGSVTVRDVVTGCRYVKTSEEAEVALMRLAAAGVGSWQPKPAGPEGGRPTRVFVLSAKPRQK